MTDQQFIDAYCEGFEDGRFDAFCKVLKFLQKEVK